MDARHSPSISFFPSFSLLNFKQVVKLLPCLSNYNLANCEEPHHLVTIRNHSVQSEKKTAGHIDQQSIRKILLETTHVMKYDPSSSREKYA